VETFWKTLAAGDFERCFLLWPGLAGTYGSKEGAEEKLKTVLEFGQLRADNMAKMKETYVALAIEPDHTRYGWMGSSQCHGW
jgi:hypothetical protein